MALVTGVAQKIWSGLNTDITPVFKGLLNQLKAMYDPQLQPVLVGECIVDWVDVRTGEKPWFS
jgi:hypothetical protein